MTIQKKLIDVGKFRQNVVIYFLTKRTELILELATQQQTPGAHNSIVFIRVS